MKILKMLMVKNKFDASV